MSSKSTVLQDNSLLSRIDQFVFRFESLLNLVGGIVIFTLIFLATTNVLGRWIFSLPVEGYIDWVEQAMAFMAFLGVAYTQREGGHIRMDIVVSRLKNKILWVAEIITSLFTLLLVLILIYGSYLHFLRAYTLGDSSLDIDLPTWPAKLVVPIAFTLLAIRLCLQIWGYLRAILNSDNSPVAVPLIEDAATTAAKEADAVMGLHKNKEAL